MATHKPEELSDFKHEEGSEQPETETHSTEESSSFDTDSSVNDEKEECSEPWPQPAILVLGGSFNPVHKAHVQLLTHVREQLHATGRYQVIGAYLVLATDFHVMYKTREWAIVFEHRQRLCQIAISDCGAQSWIKESHIECPSAQSYGRIALTLEDSFATEEQRASTQVLDCWGGDHLYGRIWRFTSKGQAVVGIARKGYNEEAAEQYAEDVANGLVDERSFVFIETEVAPVSSTEVRTHLRQLMDDYVALGDLRKDAPKDEFDFALADLLEAAKADTEEVASGSASVSLSPMDEKRKAEMREEKRQKFRNATKDSLTVGCIEYLIENASPSLFCETQYSLPCAQL